MAIRAARANYILDT